MAKNINDLEFFWPRRYFASLGGGACLLAWLGGLGGLGGCATQLAPPLSNAGGSGAGSGVFAPAASAPVAASARAFDPANASSSPRNQAKGRSVRGGGYYKDDGPGDDLPENLDSIPDAVPRLEPLHKPATRPYVALGKSYTPHTGLQPYKVQGIASWYGKRYHGQKTSIGEVYDMYAMTAAHTVLALPSYVRVTNLDNGRSIVVRVNDRGPFHADRVIDLSYTAAAKLDLIGNGSGRVEVEALLPGPQEGPSVVAASAMPSVSKERNVSPEENRDRLRLRAAAELEERSGLSASSPLATAPASAVSSRTENGIYIQLGAFASADNAEALKRRIDPNPEWFREHPRAVLDVRHHGSMYRVVLGPFASRSQAQTVAERVGRELGFQPLIR